MLDRAFTVFVRAYGQERHALQYLRRENNDADRYAPTPYGRRRSPSVAVGRRQSPSVAVGRRRSPSVAVGVMIVNDDGILVEKGTAVFSPSAANQWLYKTTAAAGSASAKTVVDVADLAGQVAEVSQRT